MRRFKFWLLGNEYTVAAGCGTIGNADVKITPNGTGCDFDLEIAPRVKKECALPLTEAYLSYVLNYPRGAVEVMLLGQKYNIEPEGKSVGTVAYKTEKCKHLFTKTVSLADLCELKVSILTYTFGNVCTFRCADTDCADRALLRRLMTLEGIGNTVATCIYTDRGGKVDLLTESPLFYSAPAVIDSMQALGSKDFKIYYNGTFIIDGKGRAAIECCKL